MPVYPLQKLANTRPHDIRHVYVCFGFHTGNGRSSNLKSNFLEWGKDIIATRIPLATVLSGSKYLQIESEDLTSLL